MEHVDVGQAMAVLTLHDDGSWLGLARFEQEQVEVAVVGDGKTARAHLAEAAEWLSVHSGRRFQLVDGAVGDIVVTLRPGTAPTATAWTDGQVILRSEVTFDPSHDRTRRWAWEELIQASGPVGDHGPVWSVLSVDQQASTPSAFDAAVVQALYGPEVLSQDAVRAELSTS